jgi:hypothetical protein
MIPQILVVPGRLSLPNRKSGCPEEDVIFFPHFEAVQRDFAPEPVPVVQVLPKREDFGVI